MNIFAKRPLFTACMIFLTCSVIGFFIPGLAKIIIIALASVALVFSLILAFIKHYSSDKKYKFLCFILILIMSVLSFASSYIYFNYNLESTKQTYNNKYTVDAFVVEEEFQSNFASRYVISVTNLDGEKDKHKAILECGFSAALQPGDKFSISATAMATERSGGRFDETLELFSENIFVIYSTDDSSSLTVHEYSDSDVITFTSINNKLSSILTRKIGGEEGKLSSALLLGNKHLLSNTVGRDFQRAGASHILALSGMHMSIIMGAAMFVMRRITRKTWIIATLLSVFAISYLALTGFSVSATRSVIMLLIVYLSMLISALPDPLTSLSVAGFLLVLLSPGSVLDAAFWMSFSATLGILVFVPPVNEFFNEKLVKYDSAVKRIAFKVLFSIIIAFVTGFAALIPLIGVLCIFIKEISVLSVISSVVLSIPTAAVIIFSLLLLPLHSIPVVSDAIVFVLRITSGFMVDYCAEVSEYEGIVYSLNYSTPILFVLVFVGLAYSLISKHKKRIYSLIPFAACILICVGIIGAYEAVNKDNLRVTYINASSTSDVIVLTNNREAMICDISNGSMTSYDLALNEIYESRATEIKAIMLTRYSNQHTSSLQMLCESYRIRELWLPIPTNDEDYDKLVRIYDFSEDNGVDVYLYDQGESLYAFGNVTVEHTFDTIDRSSVPISLIGIYTGREHITYVSPAFDESTLSELAQYHFSKSQHIIFGNKGPKTKGEYTIDDIDRVDSVAFADEIRAKYFILPEHSFTSYYLVPEKIVFYLDK